MDLREISCDDGDWIDVAKNRVQLQAYVREVINFRIL